MSGFCPVAGGLAEHARGADWRGPVTKHLKFDISSGIADFAHFPWIVFDSGKCLGGDAEQLCGEFLGDYVRCLSGICLVLDKIVQGGHLLVACDFSLREQEFGETWESLCDMMFREDVQRGEEFLAALFACPDPIIERQHV